MMKKILNLRVAHLKVRSINYLSSKDGKWVAAINCHMCTLRNLCLNSPRLNLIYSCSCDYLWIDKSKKDRKEDQLFPSDYVKCFLKGIIDLVQGENYKKMPKSLSTDRALTETRYNRCQFYLVSASVLSKIHIWISLLFIQLLPTISLWCMLQKLN